MDMHIYSLLLICLGITSENWLLILSAGIRDSSILP